MRRLSDELNIKTELEHIYRFCYTAEFGEAGSENELCHVCLGRVGGRMQPNESEISSVRFVPAGNVAQELVNNAERFTPWFKQEWHELTNNYPERLARYRDPA